MYSVKQLTDLLRRELWEKDIGQRDWLGRQTVSLGRLLQGIGSQFIDGRLNLQARSLAYTTLLSLVPFLAVSFSVLKAFGVHNQLEPILMDALEPLGEKGLEVGINILGFVENLRVGVLGTMGVAMLFYTAISLVHAVEQAFNTTWHVPSSRSLARRFSDYLSVILIGPVLLFTALSVANSAMDSAAAHYLLSIEPFGDLLLTLKRLGTYVLIGGAFAFLYGFIPNTPVRFSAALAGGVFAGVLWYTSGNIFTALVVQSSNYSAVYSGFAGAVLFIIWLYVGWLIILVGAQVAFYWQNPRYLDPRRGQELLSGRRREALALEIMTLIGHAHYYKEDLWSFESLQVRLKQTNTEVLERQLNALKEQGLILASGEKPPVYMPAHDIETISLLEVVTASRGEQGGDAKFPAVEAVMRDIDANLAQILQQRSVKDLVLEKGPRLDKS